MFFDDRLATVLRQRAQSDAMRRTQYRQLLDLLGAQASGAEGAARDPSLVAAAWMRMDALAQTISPEDRARMIREPGWRFRNPELATHLADFEPEVASAALARAQLSEEDWTTLIPRLPVRARGFLRLRRDLPLAAETLLERLGVYDRGLPQPAGSPDVQPDLPEGIREVVDLEESDPLPEPNILELDTPEDEVSPSEAEAPGPQPAPDPQSDGRSEISALVERIAQFRRTREQGHDDLSADGEGQVGKDQLMPRLPLGEDHGSRRRSIETFGFAANTTGQIEWAEPDIAPMVIGARLVEPARLGAATVASSIANSLTRAFNRRQPIVAAPFELAGADAVAGSWVVDAEPRFTDTGSFAGYVGRFRRALKPAEPQPTPAQREADRIRQLLHELRTPVTAVQGYSEVIQQQLFGSAPHEYRALAAAIASDAARILAGFEELDRLARLETGAIEIEPGESDLAALATKTVRQLASVLDARLAGINLNTDGEHSHIAAIEHSNAEALLWRLLATLGGGCAAGEVLEARLESTQRLISLSCELPTQLLSEDDIFAAEVRPIGTAINPGLFGAGFALRLARAEARASGGDLIRKGEEAILTIPRARTTLSDHPEAPDAAQSSVKHR